MTSPETHTLTTELLAKYHDFGAAAGQIRCMQQGEVPALADLEANFTLDDSDPFQIATKPHGHGDVHVLLHSEGYAKQWQTEGRKWIFMFQDTNAMAFNIVLPTLGRAAKENLAMNSVTVPRKPGEPAGAVTTLIHDDGSEVTVNVEYNQFPALVASTPQGDYVDKVTGFSPYPANTNTLCIQLAPYLEFLDRTQGFVREFVNPKYTDSTNTAFRAPTRLECMMQDYPWSLPSGIPLGYTMYERWVSYSPVKNSKAEAMRAAERGLQPMCGASGEADIYNCNRMLLSLAGIEFEDSSPLTFHDIKITPFPMVVLSAAFASTVANVLRRVRGGRVSARSSLVLQGEDITVQGLELDGALVIRAVKGAIVRVEGLKVSNAGWRLVELPKDAKVPSELMMRGYELEKVEQRVIECNEPGEYLVTE